jgi:hypothetical protein
MKLEEFMHKIPQALYQTAAEVEATIKMREEDAAKLPPGVQRQAALKQIAQLRVYAEAKRWIEPAGVEAHPPRQERARQKSGRKDLPPGG